MVHSVSCNQNFDQNNRANILNERESLLGVIRVIGLIARRDDTRATSRVDNESHGASANTRGIQSSGRGTRGGHRLASASGESRARTS